jgi:AraC-like DNA-binding protein
VQNKNHVKRYKNTYRGQTPNRRTTLTEQQDAATATFHVSYESPSQFSREYIRLFGDSPLRDIMHAPKTTASCGFVKFLST